MVVTAAAGGDRAAKWGTLAARGRGFPVGCAAVHPPALPAAFAPVSTLCNTEMIFYSENCFAFMVCS